MPSLSFRKVAPAHEVKSRLLLKVISISSITVQVEAAHARQMRKMNTPSTGTQEIAFKSYSGYLALIVAVAALVVIPSNT